MEVKERIVRGKTALGIELGSTRIKAVLVDNCGKVLAAGIHDWENSPDPAISGRIAWTRFIRG